MSLFQQVLNKSGEDFKALMKERVNDSNLTVMAIAFKEISNEEYDKFIAEFITSLKYHNLVIWKLGEMPYPPYGLVLKGPSLDAVMDSLRKVLVKSKTFYLLSLEIDPSDDYSIRIRYN